MQCVSKSTDVLLEQYKEKINMYFGDKETFILLYGSSVDNICSSDLDICLFVHSYTEEDVKKLKDITILFHRENKLEIDEEVPFENKIIYSFHEIGDMLLNPPFNIHRNEFKISPVEKKEGYLSSKEMRERLLLNILTNKYLLVQGNGKIFKEYSNQAWNSIIRVIFSYLGKPLLTIDEFISHLCTNTISGATGEDYLGYKKDDVSSLKYIRSEISRRFNTLVASKLMSKDELGKYSCSDKWIDELLKESNSRKKISDDFNLFLYNKMDGYDFSENANPLGPSQRIKDALKDCSKYINVYPDYKNIETNEKLSKFFNTSVENTAVANGSLEAIFSMPYLVNTEKSSIVVPTYWGYAAALDNLGIKYKKFFIKDDLEYHPEDIDNLAKESTLLFMCNPNNPTSTYINKEDIYKIVKDNKHCHFVIDESHLMLHDNFFDETLSADVEALGNVTLVYSLSKLFSVAGLRIGAMISNKNIVDKYKKWQVPYSLGTISQVLLPLCIEDRDFIKDTRKNIKLLVDELYQDLTQFEWLEPKYSITNFILCKIKGGITALELSNKLEAEGYYIRELTTCYPDIEGDWIRISVNTRELNKKLVNTIKNYNIKL